MCEISRCTDGARERETILIEIETDGARSGNN
jgi:hypothetical protein